MRSVYTVAFTGDEFLMVYNPKRKGWEMPGGSIEKNEKPKDAAVREYMEESGFGIDIISSADLGGCVVFAAVLGKKICGGEMRSELFSELPDDLSFERSEYDGVLEWSRSEIKRG